MAVRIVYNQRNYKGERLAKLDAAIVRLEEVINSVYFQNLILNFRSSLTDGGTFHFKSISRFQGRVTELERFTNNQILDKIVSGNVNGNISLNLILEKGTGGSSVGYTVSDAIHTYAADFDEMNIGEVAAHLFHEYMHVIGFEHSTSNRRDPLRDCFSVPYAVGNLIEISINTATTYNCRYEFLENNNN